MKKLAICIPNYGKRELLLRLLNQTISQVRDSKYIDEVEICVSDDASPDDITEDVNAIISANPDLSIKYQRLVKNKGRWGNIKEVVAMSDTEYCWVIGNDDIYAGQNAIRDVVAILFKDSPSILTFPTILYNGSKYEQYSQLPPQTGNCVLDLSDREDFSRWYASTDNWLSFFSDSMLVAFKKELWDKYVGDITLEDNGFGFWIVLSTIALSGSPIHYVEQFYIVRNFTDDADNWDDRDFSFVYLRDCFLMWKRLQQINKDAARVFDNCTAYWYLERYHLLMESDESTASQKQLIRENATDLFRLITRFYLPDNKLAELKQRKVFLFGTGEAGMKVKSKLDSHGIKIINFIDNNESKQGEYIDGIEAISPQEALNISDGFYIISAIANGAIDSIHKQLMMSNVAEENIALVNW